MSLAPLLSTHPSSSISSNVNSTINRHGCALPQVVDTPGVSLAPLLSNHPSSISNSSPNRLEVEPIRPYLALSPVSHPKPSTIKCLYTNATSLNKSILNELAIICQTEKIDIVFISETWFSEISVVSLANYRLYRRDRRGIGGGVAIYIHNNVVSSELRDEGLREALGRELAEQVWCQVEVNGERVLLGCVYRPPLNLRRNQEIESQLETAATINSALRASYEAKCRKSIDTICVVGDFNYPNVKWHEDGSATTHKSGHHQTNIARNFVETLADTSLSQCVSEPTFITAESGSSNVLDLLLTDNPTRVRELNLGPPLGSSSQGHTIIRFEFVVSKKSIDSRYHSNSYITCRGDYLGMKRHFSTLDWHSMLRDMTTEEAYTCFLSEYTKACDRFIPRRVTGRSIKRHKWLSKEVSSLSKKKKNLWHANNRTKWRCVSLIKNYKSVRNRLKHESNKAIRKHEIELANDKKNPKRLFAYVNSKKTANESITAIKDKNGKIVTDRALIATALNDQFTSVFVDEKELVEDLVSDVPTNNSIPERLDQIRVNIDDVRSKLAKLNKYKATGVDGVSPYVLNECSEELAIPLCIIFQRSLVESSVPTAWLSANVTPLFKKGSRLDPSNYRPVSLTSVPCKVLERIVRDAVVVHMIINNLICSEQHGFVPRKACVTNLLETVDFVTKNMSERIPTDIIFLDFAKAFDKVPHRRLLHKLECIGIVGQAINWICAFLSSRRQRVMMGEVASDWAIVKSGVPQGSVLAPTLFIAYVNDLPSCIVNRCKLYADDCKILARIKTINDSRALQKDIDSVVEWCNKWLMELNASKCKVMHCGRGNLRAQYTIMGRVMATTERERDLGIILTPNMKWHEQVSYAASTANRILGVLRNAFVSRDLEIWRRLYSTYVRLHLEFAVQAWCPNSKGDIQVIERVQRRATKIPHCLKNMRYEDRCEQMGIVKLTERRMRGDLIQMFKLLRGLEAVSWVSEQKTSIARTGRRSAQTRDREEQSTTQFLHKQSCESVECSSERFCRVGKCQRVQEHARQTRDEAASKGLITLHGLWPAMQLLLLLLLL